MRTAAAILALLASAATPALATEPAQAQPPAPVPAEIYGFFAAYFSAVEAGDPERILALIDGDFVLKWPGGPAVNDRERLRAALEGLGARVRQEIRWEVLEARVHGDWAWARVSETATHHPRAGGAARTFDGVHLSILRKSGGRWLLHRDNASLNAPPAEAQ